MEKDFHQFKVEFGYAASTQKESWGIQGDYWSQKRKEYGISRRAMASRLATSENRLARFEKGEPVRNANSIVISYKMQFEIVDLKEEIRLLKKHGSTSGFEANKSTPIFI